MTFSEFEIKRFERAIDKFMAKRRPPAHVRDQVDFCFHIDEQSVELSETRPHFRDASKRIEIPFAKALFESEDKHWKIFWHKSDMRWHNYEPLPVVKHFEEFLDVVAEDRHSYFFS